MKLPQNYLEFLALLHKYEGKEMLEDYFDEEMTSHYYRFPDLDRWKIQAIEDSLIKIETTGKLRVVYVNTSVAITKVSKEPPF
jgi:hypothetical protein